MLHQRPGHPSVPGIWPVKKGVKEQSMLQSHERALHPDPRSVHNPKTIREKQEATNCEETMQKTEFAETEALLI